MTTRRAFLSSTTAAAAAAQGPARHDQPLDAALIARRHSLVRTQPTPDFFEGLLLGNGDIGVCVTVRPDAMGIHIGKNDVWDIRVSEEHAAHIKHFRDVLELWKRAGEEAKRQGKPDMLFLESNIDFFASTRSGCSRHIESHGLGRGPAESSGCTGTPGWFVSCARSSISRRGF